MESQQKSWNQATQWQNRSSQTENIAANLVLAFGNRYLLAESDRYKEIQSFYPNAQIVICSTSGEIIGTNVQDDSIVLNAIKLDRTDICVEQLNHKDFDSSLALGKEMTSRLKKDKLKHVMVFSDGQFINGSELVKGLNEDLSDGISVTGGLAGDGARFEKTLVGLNDAPVSGNVVGIGFYGDQFKVGFGSVGGWDPFGPKRRVTKSENNVLYELDGQSALALYKKYLGDKADELPASGLLFPLNMQLADDKKPLVRTILSVNEEDQSMTFAGDLPEGATVQLMRANYDRIIDAAFQAAEGAKMVIKDSNPELAILISCVGRKLVLDQMVEEEVESTADLLGNKTPMIGFYSYGEISPFSDEFNCELHNQTMTVTILSEN